MRRILLLLLLLLSRLHPSTPPYCVKYRWRRPRARSLKLAHSEIGPRARGHVKEETTKSSALLLGVVDTSTVTLEHLSNLNRRQLLWIATSSCDAKAAVKEPSNHVVDTDASGNCPRGISLPSVAHHRPKRSIGSFEEGGCQCTLHGGHLYTVKLLQLWRAVNRVQSKERHLTHRVVLHVEDAQLRTLSCNMRDRAQISDLIAA